MGLNRVLIIAIICAGSTACDGQYSTTASSDGSVIIVNRFTGVVRKVQGEAIQELHLAPPPVATTYRPLLALESIPQQPISIRGIAKYRNGNMSVRVVISPSDSKMSKEAWTDWRSHIDAARIAATLNLEFMDSDGFRVLIHRLALSDMTRTVDLEGQMDQLNAQVDVPLPFESFSQITGWQMGWSGWPDFRPSTPKPSPDGPT